MNAHTVNGVVDLFTFSHSSNRNKQGGCVTLMWLVALSSVISVLWCGHAVLRRNPLRKNGEFV